MTHPAAATPDVSRTVDGLRMRGVGFGYGTTPVLSGVDFEAIRGTSTAIMGASGSGKSTLLQVLAGMLRPQEGVVEVGDLRLSDLPERRRNQVRLRHFGFVFQFGELLPELSLLENVELPLLFLGSSRRESAQRAANALDEVGLVQQRNRRLHEVSGGQQQRAALARALVHDPSVLLADEPTGSLDEATAGQVLDLVLASAERHRAAVVLVTHARAVAQRCDRTFQLESGSLRPLAHT